MNVFILWLSLVLFSVVLVGCQADAYPELMPDQRGEYSVLWIRGEGERTNGMISYDIPPVFNDVNKLVSPRGLEQANEKYPKLELEQSPAFVIFDESGVVMKTYDEKEAMDFLEKVYEE